MSEPESYRSSQLVEAIAKLSKSPAKPLREDTYFRLPITMTIADADLCAYLARTQRSFLFLPDFDTFTTQLIIRTTNEGWKHDKLPALVICPTADIATDVEKTTGIESVSAENFFRDLDRA